MTSPLYQYQNGNYQVTIYPDGTKVRETEADVFLPHFSENVDLKITDYCEVACPMCHEKSTVQGLHGDLTHPALSTFPRGTELAIGGGNPLSHPGLVRFLEQLKAQGVIANLTVNQVHFLQQENLLHELTATGLVHGLGVSLTHPGENFIKRVTRFENAVIHVINGYHAYSQLEKLFGHDLKLLILGYKHFGRGVAYFSPEVTRRQAVLYAKIHAVLKSFRVVSFDNLAIEQLNIKRLMTTAAWETFYMGDDGNFTFYMDAVKQEFTQNSFYPTRYPMLDSVTAMFQAVRAMDRKEHNPA